MIEQICVHVVNLGIFKAGYLKNAFKIRIRQCISLRRLLLDEKVKNLVLKKIVDNILEST